MIKYTAQAATGSKAPKDAEDPTVIAGRFARQKAAPWVAAAFDTIKHKSVVGTPRSWTQFHSFSQMINENIGVGLIAPMVVGDFTDAMTAEGGQAWRRQRLHCLASAYRSIRRRKA
jgi:hypothetical protein